MEPIAAGSFGKSHIKLIALSILLLVAATFMRGGFTLGAFGFSSAESAPEKMTYEQAQAKAKQMIEEKYSALPAGGQDPEQLQQQLAEVDPNYGQGAVLGTSVTSDGNIDVESLMGSDALKAVDVKTYSTDNKLELNAYGSQIRAIENKHGAFVLMGALSTREKSALAQASTGYKNIISDLQSLAVPEQFEEYHRMKLIYYSALVSMAESMASEGPNEQAATATSLFFSLNDKIDTLGSQLESQYGVLL